MVHFVPGRLAPHPEETHPRLHLGDYLTSALPTPPAVINWYSKVGDWPVFLNDQIGDCTEAMVAHVIENASTYGEGATITVTDDDVLAAYERVSGYVPGDPSTDNGAVLQDVYRDWQKVGVAGHKNLAYAQVNIADLSEVKQAGSLFGDVGLGIVVTQDMMDAFNAGQPWTTATGQQLGGHAVPAVGYDADFVYVVTWGRVQRMSWDCFRAVTDEGWVAVLPEWMNTQGVDPQGLDLYALGEDLAQLTGGTNPFPQPKPIPPSPTPPPGPTPEPPPAPSPEPGLLGELANLIREVASDAERGIQHIVSWLHEHNL